ncbi:MAG: hypothetical protein N2Z74_04820 [Syntrophales bacterium]|nr:hypothetical protein [Syntrophales bacterium]
MKKFWVVLLTLGLIMAFAMPAAAVDVKFSGQYYVYGWYVDNPSLKDKDKANDAGPAALYSQRLRVQTEFQVVEGLKLVTRFDALEKNWGSYNWRGGTGETQTRRQIPYQTTTGGGAQQVTTNTQENIEFERVYVDFNTAIGKFQVGYQQFLTWGTDFLNTPLTAAGIRYIGSSGPMQWIAAIGKRRDAAASNMYNSTTSNIGKLNDGDSDVYDLGFIYKFKNGEAGLMYQYARNAYLKWTDNGRVANPYLQNLHLLLPYAKATFGPLFVEGELVYGGGDWRKFEPGQAGGNKDYTAQAYGAFLHARYDLKPVYVGAQFVYLSGDDPGKDDQVTGNIATALTAGYGFDRCLILWNSAYLDAGFAGTSGAGFANVTTKSGVNVYNGAYMDNVWFYQLYGGIKPMPKLDIKAALSYAYADKKPRQTYGQPVGAANPEFVSDKYGTELDVTATYKIFDNLEYMLGAGYLWTGDFFKGTSDANIIKNNYVVLHKLTLNF